MTSGYSQRVGQPMFDMATRVHRIEISIKVDEVTVSTIQYACSIDTKLNQTKSLPFTNKQLLPFKR